MSLLNTDKNDILLDAMVLGQSGIKGGKIENIHDGTITISSHGTIQLKKASLNKLLALLGDTKIERIIFQALAVDIYLAKNLDLKGIRIFCNGRIRIFCQDSHDGLKLLNATLVSTTCVIDGRGKMTFENVNISLIDRSWILINKNIPQLINCRIQCNELEIYTEEEKYRKLKKYQKTKNNINEIQAKQLLSYFNLGGIEFDNFELRMKKLKVNFNWL